MLSESTKKLFVNKYLSIGEDKFYAFLLNYSNNKINESDTEGGNPALELIEYYTTFLKLYRKEGDTIYLDLAKLFRKAAHKIYRTALKKGLVNRNLKFLNLI